MSPTGWPGANRQYPASTSYILIVQQRIFIVVQYYFNNTTHLSEVIPLNVEVTRSEWNTVCSLAGNVGDIGNLYCVCLWRIIEAQCSASNFIKLIYNFSGNFSLHPNIDRKSTFYLHKLIPGHLSGW